MKHTILVLLAAVCASVVTTSAMAWNTRDTVIVLGTAAVTAALMQPRQYYGAVPPQQYYGGAPPPAFYTPPRQYSYNLQPNVIHIPSTLVVVDGAVDNRDGTCVQTSGRSGVIRDGACYVPNQRY